MQSQDDLTPSPSPKWRGEKKKEWNIPKRGVMSSGVVALQYVEEYKKEQARELRKKSTPAEKNNFCRWEKIIILEHCFFTFNYHIQVCCGLSSYFGVNTS